MPDLDEARMEGGKAPFFTKVAREYALGRGPFTHTNSEQYERKCLNEGPECIRGMGKSVEGNK